MKNEALTANNNWRVLFVEDDPIIAAGLVYALEKEGYIVTHANTVAAAKNAALSQKYDIAILDIGLPDGTGFDLVTLLKSADTSTVFLTAVDDEGNIVRAFEGGADDYVTKPFRFGELMARIKATLRRRTGQGNIIEIGNVTINISKGKVFAGSTDKSLSGVGTSNALAGGKALVGVTDNALAIDLTALEYRLLLIFANHKGQLLSRGQILNHLWDSEGIFVEDNTLSVYVKRLREKLGSAVQIETVRGAGYRAES